MLSSLLKRQESINLLLIVALAIVWFIWLYGNGIGLSADSTYYLNYSIYIKNDFDFSHLRTVWPPAYPALVAAGQFIMDTPTQSAALISAIMLFLTFYFLNRIMLIANLSLIIRIFAILSLFFNPRFLYIFQFAWSETPFTVAYLGVAYFLIRHFNEQKIKFLIYASFLASVASLSRYLGYSMIILILSYTTYYQFFKNDLLSKSSIINYTIALASGFLSFLWIVRNYFLDGTFHGPRRPSSYTVIDNVSYLVKTVYWDNKHIFLIFLPLLIIGVYRFSRSGFKFKDQEKITIVIFSIATLIYTLLTLYSASTTHFDRLNTRFFSPTYPYVVFIFFWTVKIVINEFTEKCNFNSLKKPIVISLLWFSLVGLLVTLQTNNYFNKSRAVNHPITLGYNKSKLKTEVERWLLNNLMEKGSINLLILAGDPKQEYPRLHVSRALLLRELEGVKDYNYSGDGHSLKLSIVVQNSEYSVNFIPINSINDDFFSNLYTSKTLALIDETRLEQFKNKYDSHSCKIEKLHTLFGVECIN